MTDTRRPAALSLVVALLLSLAGTADAAVNANWRELMGSASGGGVSQSPAGTSTHTGSVAAGLDGRPVVTYAEETDETNGKIVVKRWTGSAWQILSPAAGIGRRGYNPQISIALNGTMYVAWLGYLDNQVHLRRRTAAGTVWEELSGSDGPLGLTGFNSSSVGSFSLAVTADSNPIVAFSAPSQVGVAAGTDGILLGSYQAYVVRHTAAGGWQYLGSSPFTDGAGASDARSLMVDGGASYAVHSVGIVGEYVRLAIDSANRPVVAFPYVTTYPSGPRPAEFVLTGPSDSHSDIFVTRFEANSSAWTAVGPAVPQVDDAGAARGGPGGISVATHGIWDITLGAARTGDRLYVGWTDIDLTGNGQSAIFLRRWDGLGTWDELSGSASGGGISGTGSNGAPSLAVDANTNVIVAWSHYESLTNKSDIFVLRSNSFDVFEEMGPDSAAGDGISGNPPGGGASNPWVAFFDGPTAAVPDNVSVSWINGRSGQPSQAYLRQFTQGVSFPLTVIVSPPGAGRVRSTPIGIDCPDDVCSEMFPSGTIVGLTPIAGPDHLFDRWFGACTGTGPCNVPATANRSVNASFVSAATLTVATDGLGTVTGTGINCGGPGGTDCSEKYRLGTVVTLTVKLPVGTLFGGWGGFCGPRGTNTTCAVPITGNQSVYADFNQRVYRVTASLTNPANTVVNGAGGILYVMRNGGPLFDCSHGEGACSGQVEHGDRVGLFTWTEPGNKFLSYAGTLCSGRTNATCPDTIATGNHTVTSLIRGVTAILANKLGNGANKSVLKGPALDCGLDCIGEAFTGTQVVIAQTPGVGNRLLGFSGPPGCTGQTCSFLATGTNQTFNATYQLNQYLLSVNGDGLGFTQSRDGGIDCGSVPGHFDCSQIYNHGDVVELTPYPGVDSRFLSWTGCSRLNGTVCVVDMLGNRAVFKRFGAARTLFLNGSGNGRGRYLVPGQAPFVCQGNCSTSYLLPFNQAVAVTPTPDTGSNFVWDTGVCAGRGGSCSYLMNANQSGSGRFRLNRHRLVVTNRANGSVTSVTPFPDSSIIDCGSGDNICTSEQDFGTRVHVQAEADEGNFFVNWTGGSPCSVGARATNSSCDFVLQGNVTLIPTFRARTAVLIDKEGNGAGLVTGPGFNCGADCAENIFDSKRITLLATASLGSRFDGYDGACVSNTSACSFVPTGNNQTVFATFSLLPFTFTVTSRNQGVVESINGPADGVECGAGSTDCTSTLLFGTDVVLQAYPLPGFAFVNWIGDAVCAGKTNSTCAFKVPARNNFVITPNYRPRTFLSVVKTGNGDGLVTGPAINCGPDCAEPIVDGKAVTLLARAAVGSIFEGFGPPCSGNSSTCTFTPGGENQSVSATFSLLPFTLTVASRNQGVVRDLPPPADLIECGGGFTDCSETALFGTVFVFRAEPNDGFVFDRWGPGGPCAGSTNSTCTHRLVANTLATPIYRAQTLVAIVKDGNGAGTVTGMGFNCGADCLETVFDGRAVGLTAAAAVGSRFDGFDGACVSNTSTCTFFPTGNNQTVFATFVLQQFVVNVTTRANSSVTGTIEGVPIITCGSAGSDCSEVVDFSRLVSLVAQPEDGFRFVNWTGDTVCNGRTNNTCSFAMPTRNVSVTPNYQRATLVRIFPDGQGVTTAGPAAARTINCVSGQPTPSNPTGVTGDCTETVLNDAAIALIATPATGWDFAFWDDPSCSPSNDSTCTFFPTGAVVDVYPVFFRESRVVTVTVLGNGSVTAGFDFCDASSPCVIERLFGDQVILSASPAPGQEVVWTGCTANGSTCSLVLNTAVINRMVTATFQPVADVTVTVGGSGLVFSSPSVTIQAGQTVRWNWAGSNHNVVSGNGTTGVADGRFCSPGGDVDCSPTPLRNAPFSYSRTFTEAGTFTYFCSAHFPSGMRGTITVQPIE